MLDIMHESHEDPNTDAHRPVADEDKPPPLVNQSPSLVAGLNCATSNDVIPTNGDSQLPNPLFVSTCSFFPGCIGGC
jgi:hypothetical protein